MRRYRRVWVVYRKELLDTLRDRRTLIAMVAVPIVLYPALMLVLVEALRKETGRRRAERYQIVVPTDAHKDWLTRVLEREDQERDSEAQAIGPEGQRPDAPSIELSGGLRGALRGDQLDILVAPPRRSLWQIVDRQECHVALIIEPPPNPEQLDDDVNRVVQILYRDTDPRSEFAYHSVTRILDGEADRVVRNRVTRRTGTAETLTPFLAAGVSTASPAQQHAKILAMVVPFLLVTMTVTGAMYPAIDLTAGERERGTLETLAVSPVPVGQIVAGKFCVVVTIAMLSTALNLGSMSAMVRFSRLDKVISAVRPSERVEAAVVAAQIESRPPSAAPATYGQRDYLEERRKLEHAAMEKAGFLTRASPIVLLAMVPFAVLSAAIMLAVCSFARTFKEAQNYMMPVMMAAIIPALVVSYMPTIRLSGVMQVVPVANIVVLIRELFLGNYDGPAIFICLMSTCLYAVAAVVVAAKLYGHEAVLFSDVGSYRALLSRRSIRPQDAPWPSLALLTVALAFPVYFYWQSYLFDPTGGVGQFRIVLGLAQVLLLAAPPMVLAWYFKLDPRRTFSLELPRAAHWLGALFIAAAIVPVSSFVAHLMTEALPSLRPTDDLFEEQAALLTGGSLAAAVAAFAVVPGICEELLFRGFLLAGLRQKLSAGGTILAVGILFGVFHVYIEKIPIVSLLGMLLALICLRTGSIYPAMLVHVANNGVSLAAAKLEAVRNLLGLPGGEEAVRFDTTSAAYLTVFLIGLLLIVAPRRRVRL
jgi:ABC-type Na+ efflux pump permease subunit/membrane protease YdiL (CAAX protease family)